MSDIHTNKVRNYTLEIYIGHHDLLMCGEKIYCTHTIFTYKYQLKFANYKPVCVCVFKFANYKPVCVCVCVCVWVWVGVGGLVGGWVGGWVGGCVCVCVCVCVNR